MLSYWSFWRMAACQGYSPKSASTEFPEEGGEETLLEPFFFLLILRIFLTISVAAGSRSRAFRARSEDKF